MATHQFLSPEWIAEAKLIRDEYADRLDDPAVPLRANVVVTGAPFGDGSVHGHIDTTDGAVIVEDGHLDEPQLTVEVPWEVARSIFIERDPQAAMRAFMGGAVKVTGDVSRILALQLPEDDSEATELAREVSARLDAITAPVPD